MKRTVLLASTVLATVALSAACAARSGNDGPSTATPTFTGVKWRAYAVTVDADNRTVIGHDGCNSFSGEAVVNAGRSAITFGGKYKATAIACCPPDHVDVIPSAGTYEARTTARTLTLTGPDGQVVSLRR
ncbi:META domain-containing protein [Streptomyces sp. NPDC047061]|uniref:META domain-containing protein n=1 Tax=Streptomyces sp. NPDC047061 TaxID=3154605 RepID=UPI0033E2B295